VAKRCNSELVPVEDQDGQVGIRCEFRDLYCIAAEKRCGFPIEHSGTWVGTIKKVLSAFSLLLTAYLPLALDPSRMPWHYARSQWQDRDGLPQNTVQAIAQTADGYVWLGTEGGLVRYNGREFVSFSMETEAAFRSNSVTSLAALPDGQLWIGTRAGLLSLRGGAFRRMSAGNGLSGNGLSGNGLRNETVRALAATAGGGLLVGTNGGIGVLSAGVSPRLTQWFGAAQGLPSNAIRALSAGPGGQWFAGTASGLASMAGEIATRADLPNDTVRAVLFDRQQRLWVGYEAEGLYVIEKGLAARRLGPREGIESSSIRALLEDRDGNLWIGTVGAGLYRWHEGRFDRLSRREGLASDHVRALFEDREGSIWVGLEAGGLTQLRDARAITYLPSDGLATDFVRAVHANRAGELWVGTEGGGLFRREGERFAAEVSSGLGGGFVTALLTARDGSRWIGTEGQGALRLSASGRQAYSTSLGTAENSVWALAEGRDGSVWLGSSNGLLSIHKDQQRIWRASDGLRGNSIRSLHAARDGSLWIGLRSAGLQRLRGGAIENVAMPEEGAITSFLEESGGRIWMSSSRGILYWDGSRMHRASRRDGLPGDNLFQVLDDGEGRLWFSGMKGIFGIAKAELLKFFEAPRSMALRVDRITSADGMLSNECSGDAQPAGARTADGSLWFATIRGLVRIPPAGLKSPARSAPPVVVEEVAVNGEAVGLRSEYRSPAGNRLFRVRFAALSFLDPGATRYRYRLRDRDPEWIETEGDAEAVYHALPAGAYRFEVQAAHRMGEWSAPAALALEVAPQFYQTLWFLGLVAGAVFGAAYLAYWQRARAMRREFSAVLGERTRIAREIHDTLLQGFAGAALQLGAIGRQLKKNPEKAERDLEGVLDQIDLCLAEARSEIGELRDVGTPAAPFEARLLETAQAACAGSELRAVVQLHGKKRQLGAEIEKNLLRIARESATNAARHANATRIEMDLYYDGGTVRLLARDNGGGLAASDPAREHFGIAGMRERTEQLGGSFRMRSEADRGTEVEVTLPLRSPD
jgi:ligand-binding sensor domain-containing protein/signal transduction histidine kinase